MNHLRRHAPGLLASTILALVAVISTTAVAQIPAPDADRAARIQDVRLAGGGILRGQIVSPQGKPATGLRAEVLQAGRKVTEVRTDNQGRLVIGGLRGGLYTIVVHCEATNDQPSLTERTVRLWAIGTAPPNASDGVLVVVGSGVTRGELPRLSITTRRAIVTLLIGAGIIIAHKETAS
jgi:hypothetical protein